MADSEFLTLGGSSPAALGSTSSEMARSLLACRIPSQARSTIADGTLRQLRCELGARRVLRLSAKSSSTTVQRFNPPPASRSTPIVESRSAPEPAAAPARLMSIAEQTLSYGGVIANNGAGTGGLTKDTLRRIVAVGGKHVRRAHRRPQRRWCSEFRGCRGNHSGHKHHRIPLRLLHGRRHRRVLVRTTTPHWP